MFSELHGDLPVSQITRTHARQFREALQDVPRIRSGKLLKATLPELAQWGREHPEAQRISAATVNKNLGGVQAVAVWASGNGMVPEHIVWADPFSRMRLDEEDSDREPFEVAELQTLFSTPLFTSGERPRGGGGEAAFWLPLLALFSGARQGELAGLTVGNVQTDADTKHPVMVVIEDRERDKTLKTKSSRRTVPVHPELIRLGFMHYVTVRGARGADAWLFPELSPEHGGQPAWSKWFSRYIRKAGITDKDKVFHSLRHNFKDAIRKAGLGEDINDALTGHSGAGTVGRRYGAKDTVKRFGMPALISAVASVAYPGLDLSAIRQRR
jgi:integrase